jgi:hypothetical protein
MPRKKSGKFAKGTNPKQVKARAARKQSGKSKK